MVKALHRAGIEVILDVVFNHTAEGDHTGPTLSFRGLDNSTYYILQDDRSRYANYSGTGNTLNANHPIVRRMIVDSLRYWVEAMHVDGFRFDLASILGRDESGNLMPTPPVLWDIESDPALAGTKIIAEAWDAAGLYQVGSFIGDSWREWNGRFRDDVRSFFRGDERFGATARGSIARQPPDLRSQGARGRGERELRHVSRRVHPQRPRLLRPQAQRGEWRGQPGWRERQPERQLGCRGPDRRPGDRETAEPSGEELPHHDHAVAGLADDLDGRRGSAHPTGEQQRLLPGQRDQLVRLDAGREARGRASVRHGCSTPTG